jgi:hypothetical protein
MNSDPALSAFESRKCRRATGERIDGQCILKGCPRNWHLAGNEKRDVC